MIIAGFIIVITSFIQSLFGAGIVLLGLPSLILLGHDYLETLSLVLSCSLVLSLTQTFQNKIKSQSVGNLQKSFLIWGFPLIGIGSILSIMFQASFKIHIFIGFVLLLSVFLKFFKPALSLINNIVTKYQSFYLLLTGLIHGFSNAGGGLLTLWASKNIVNPKELRTVLAFCYIFMNAIQILILLWWGKFYLELGHFIILLLSFLTYILVGNRAYQKINQKIYQKLINGLIVIIALLLIFKDKITS